MKSFLFGFITALSVLVLAGLFVIYGGRAPLSAADAGTPLLDWLFHTSYEEALARHAAEIEVPAEMDSQPQLFRGAISFAEMCSGCHRPPGTQPTPYSAGMKPAPPELVELMRERSAAEAYWVLDNGIHFSGMPAIGKTHDDEELWALVDFLERARAMGPEDYERIIELARQSQSPADDHSGHDHEH